MALNWQHRLPLVICVLACGAACHAQIDEIPGGILIADHPIVEVWSIPQPSPTDGLVATTLLLRTTTGVDADRLVTLDRVQITGPLHQVHGLHGTMPTPTLDSVETLQPELRLMDSHWNLRAEMVGGEAEKGFTGLTEGNDRSNPGGLSRFDGVEFGLGDLVGHSPFGAFFLDTPFQTNRLELAHLVKPADSTEAVRFSGGVFGECPADNCNWAWNTEQAYWSDLEIPFQVAEPSAGAFLMIALIACVRIAR